MGGSGEEKIWNCIFAKYTDLLTIALPVFYNFIAISCLGIPRII
jgi:hypothetical protein